MTPVSTWMSTPVVSVGPLDFVERAREVMEERRINQLPVVQDGRLVGIVTDRDLGDAFPSLLDVLSNETESPILPPNVRVGAVMTRGVLTVAPGETVARAADMLRRERIGSAPVVDQDHVVGILTRSDCLAALIAAATSVHSHRRRARPQHGLPA